MGRYNRSSVVTIVAVVLIMAPGIARVPVAVGVVLIVVIILTIIPVHIIAVVAVIVLHTVPPVVIFSPAIVTSIVTWLCCTGAVIVGAMARHAA